MKYLGIIQLSTAKDAVARNGLWSSGHPYVCIVQAVVQALVIANYKMSCLTKSYCLY